MNKRETVWLIVRLIGVYFFYSAVVTVFSLTSAVSALYSLSANGSSAVRPDAANSNQLIPSPPVYVRPEGEPPASNKTDPAAEKLKSEAFKTILFYIFLTAVYGGIGFYLIRKGRFLFDILNNETSGNKREDNPAVTTLKL